MSNQASPSECRPRRWALTGALLLALGEKTAGGCGFSTGLWPCPRRLQLPARGEAVGQKGTIDGGSASPEGSAILGPAGAFLVLLAAVAASLLLSQPGHSPALSNAELEAVLDGAYQGRVHVDVDRLEFSKNETVLDQYVRGFSEGFSLGPLLREWRSNLHPRLAALLARHPPAGEQREFWDLGCGTGESLLKAFLTAREGLATEWVGLERMPDRYRLAATALDRLLQRAEEPDRVGQVLRSKLGLDGHGDGAVPEQDESGKGKNESVQGQGQGSVQVPMLVKTEEAKCIGRAGRGRICVLQGDIMEIQDYSQARVIFLNIDDPYQIVTHQVLTGPLSRSTAANTALIVSYPLGDSDSQGWQPEAVGFEVEQDWSGKEEDRGKWFHSLYRRVAIP